MLDRIRRWLSGAPEEPGPLPEIGLRPIGVVRNRIKRPMMYGWHEVSSDIVLHRELVEGLLGLDDYSHIIVLSWMHAVPQDVRGSKLQLHPLDNPEFPLQGILATRSQIRPNPVAFAVVPLLGIKGNVLRVRGLDAIDGTPVVDVKPYIPYYDAVPDGRIPDWAHAILEKVRTGDKP